MSESTAVEHDVRAARRWIVGAAAVCLFLVGSLVAGVVLGTTFFVHAATMGRSLGTSVSPDGEWTVRTRIVDPGGSRDLEVLVEAVPSGFGAAQEILRIQGDDLEHARYVDVEHLEIRWLSSRSVEVGGYSAVIPGR